MLHRETPANAFQTGPASSLSCQSALWSRLATRTLCPDRAFPLESPSYLGCKRNYLDPRLVDLVDLESGRRQLSLYPEGGPVRTLPSSISAVCRAQDSLNSGSKRPG